MDFVFQYTFSSYHEIYFYISLNFDNVFIKLHIPVVFECIVLNKINIVHFQYQFLLLLQRKLLKF